MQNVTYYKFKAYDSNVKHEIQELMIQAPLF
jgi:hypothetical protein